MGFYRPLKPPIDWDRIEMPDPEDERDAWVVVSVAILLLVAALYAAKYWWPV